MTADPTPATGERTTSDDGTTAELIASAYYDRPVTLEEIPDAEHFVRAAREMTARNQRSFHAGVCEGVASARDRDRPAPFGERTTSETTAAGPLVDGDGVPTAIGDAVAALCDCDLYGFTNDEHADTCPTTHLRALLAETPAEDEGAVKAAALREAADAIQALHPGEVKNSVIFLRERADRMETGQNMPQDARGSDLTASQPPQVPLDPDAGDWACTCGDWHPPTQTACQRGEQITTVGEGWL